jgi:hypothetical protein
MMSNSQKLLFFKFSTNELQANGPLRMVTVAESAGYRHGG